MFQKIKQYIQRSTQKIKQYIAPVLAVGVGIFTASEAKAEMVSLINFTELASDVLPLLTTAVGAAAGVGALVLAARLCWGFFKKFARG